MKQILILTDFSKSSINATNYAMTFFENEKCHYHLMYVHKTKHFTMDDLIGNRKSIYEALLKKEKQQLEELKKSLEKSYKQQTFSTIIDYDNLLSAIKQIIKNNAIELIVAGYDGTTNVFEMVFGSNTLQIIRNIVCPTLIVPEEVQYKEPKDVLLPLDENDSLDSNEFDNLLNFLNKNHTHFHVLRMSNKKQWATLDNKHLESKVNHYTYHNIENVAFVDAVSTYQQLQKIDLIGLIVEKESFIKRLITESSTTKISKSLSLPLLIVHH